MSASIFWEPAERKKHRIPTGTPSRFVEVVPPGLWDESNLDYLRGLQAMGLEGACNLIKAIEKHGAVVVSAEY